VQQSRNLHDEQKWTWCCKSDNTNEIANLKLNRKNGTTHIVLQSENEIWNWSDKSAITNGVANLKLDFKKSECSAKWCC
jgi:hypothetical protein